MALRVRAGSIVSGFIVTSPSHSHVAFSDMWYVMIIVHVDGAVGGARAYVVNVDVQ